MQVRDYVASDEDAVVQFGLQAWAPIFGSMRAQLGATVFDALYTDWRLEQDHAIRTVLSSDDISTWVAAADDDSPIGFASARANREQRIGEIVMLAVDPRVQRSGIGLQLTNKALDWMRKHGVRVAMVETGGDPGHAAARATYAKAQFTLMPIARYFKVL
jgi:GNAT superfamily N-acetyltransferase